MEKIIKLFYNVGEAAMITFCDKNKESEGRG